MSESFNMGMEAVHRRMEWDIAVQEVEQAVRFRLEAMATRYDKSTEEDRERLAQAWARILQG
tara:strand:+ start:6501 stop:6686 length:186 start_codon:yes stop_codon:yes gene_type:complete